VTLALDEAADAERRAQLYRDERQQRMQFQAALMRSRAGDHAAWLALYDRWLPLFDWLAEREEPGIDSETELDPFGMSDQVNVGR